jgi:uncharacterized protein (TIGR02118 family)
VIKLSFCLIRRAELTHQEFIEYWYQRHAPLVREHSKAIGIFKYVQSRALDHPVNELLRRARGAPAGYDGIAEVYYQSAEALQQAMFEPAARSAGLVLLEDEKRFIDLARSPLFVCIERAIIEPFSNSIHP